MDIPNRDEERMSETCPGCGMPRSEWPNTLGVPAKGATYCCRGCADGTGCTCVASPKLKVVADHE